jgi:hypothetical protein
MGLTCPDQRDHDLLNARLPIQHTPPVVTDCVSLSVSVTMDRQKLEHTVAAFALVHDHDWRY